MLISVDQAQTLYTQLLQIHIDNQQNWRHSIRDFRILFESVFRHITKNETQAFSNLFARTIFVIDKYQVPSTIVDEINGFRRLANKVAHEDGFELSEVHYHTSLKALSLIIKHFSKEDIPESLSDLYYNKGVSLTFSRTIRKVYDVLPKVKCVVRNFSEIGTTEAGVKNFTLFCEDEDSLGSFSLKIWQTKNNDLTVFRDLIWKYCTINLLNIRKVENNENLYTSAGDTALIIEPDFLVDVTDVAECFQKGYSNPKLFILSKLSESVGNPAAFKGKLVNDLLDELINDPNAKPNETLQRVISQNSLKSIRFGEDKINEIKKDIQQTHYDNLVKVAKEYSKQNIRIEPTFFSSVYGLQGRLDAMIEHPDDPYRKDVFELKSGKPPYGTEVWENNRMQVVAYNMLLRSTFGEQRTGNSSIFYSAAVENSLRNVASVPLMELQLISVRNSLVSMLNQICICDYSVLDSLCISKFGSRPSFKDGDIISFEAAYRSANELERVYYQNCLSFSLREHHTAKTGSFIDEGREENGFASLWLDPIDQKEKRFNILHGLQFHSFDSVKGTITFSIKQQLNHNFREGDIGLIYPKDNDVLQPLKWQILKGNITNLNSDTLVFALRNKQMNEAYFKSCKDWVIEHDLYESNYWCVTQSLLDFLKASKRFKNLLFGLQEPESQDIPFEPSLNFNSNQNKLIEKALCAKDYFLLQGPPGTGKTSTMLVNLADRLKETGDNIVILAFTNRAVDEICNKLRDKGIGFLRLGGKSSDKESLSGNTANMTVLEMSRFLASYKIIISTVATFSMRADDMKQIKLPDVLILDEASQLTEPQVVTILSLFKKFILIGDQNQLPAVITQSGKLTKISDERLNAVGIVDFSQSIFERLYKMCEQKGWTHAYGMLEDHYRMHNEIAALITDYYGGKLKSYNSQQKEVFKFYNTAGNCRIQNLLSTSRTIFIQTGRHQTSKTNQEEAIKVAAILKTIKEHLGSNFSKETVGVVTPWRAQIALIKSFINDEEILEKVSIDTVERFQGSEKDIIIASLAVYHPSQLTPLQSLSLDGTVDRKLLVTISRARQQLIILGHQEALYNSEHYRRMLDKVRSNDGYIEHTTGMQHFKSWFENQN